MATKAKKQFVTFPVTPATYKQRGALVEIPVKIKVSEYLLASIIISAIESGIHGIYYWCPKQRLRAPKYEEFDPEVDFAPEGGPDFDITVIERTDDEVWDEFIARNVALGGTLTFYEDVEESGDETTFKAHTLTRTKLIEGLSKYLANHRPSGGMSTENAKTGEMDLDLDGPDCDLIIQYALLGEITYG